MRTKESLRLDHLGHCPPKFLLACPLGTRMSNKCHQFGKVRIIPDDGVWLNAHTLWCMMPINVRLNPDYLAKCEDESGLLKFPRLLANVRIRFCHRLLSYSADCVATNF